MINRKEVNLFMKRLLGHIIYKDNDYNLSDLNWKDDTLENGIGDIDGSDPSMKGYNKGWQQEPYKDRYYANKKKAAKEVNDISYDSENLAREILELWSQADGPLQNFFEAFTMNKVSNKMKKEIADIIRKKGYEVYPVLTDETERYASFSRLKKKVKNIESISNVTPFDDMQLSYDSLTSMEKMLNEQSDGIGDVCFRNGLCSDFGMDMMTQMRSDISVPPNVYEVNSSKKQAGQINNIPYNEVMNAINEASKNVAILLNRKLQTAPIFIKSIRKQNDKNVNSPEYKVVNITNIVTQYEIWQVFLDLKNSRINDCFIVIKGDYIQRGYKQGKWTNVEYCGFYCSPEEAENEIQGNLN